MEKREHLGLLQNRAAEFAIKSDQLRDQIQVRKTELGSLEQQLTQIERGKAELSGGNATFTFSNPPKAGTLITIVLVQDGTGSRTVTWPATVKWSGGTAPTLTTTASKRDVFTFVYDGSNYYNTSQQLNQ